MSTNSSTTNTIGPQQYTGAYSSVTYTSTSNIASGTTITWNPNITATAVWDPTTYSTITASSIPYTNDINADALDVAGNAIVKGSLEVKGDIKMGEQTLSDRLNKIEERLAILNQNPNLESRWDPLKKLGEEYRAMEKDLLDKENMWEILQR